MILGYIFRRLIGTIPFLFAVSIVVFALIQAPPGDYLSTFVAKLAESDETVDQATIELLRERYGLNEPFYVQYWKWISHLVVGDFGVSMEWNESVWDLIASRLPMTLVLMFSTFIAAWAIA